MVERPIRSNAYAGNVPVPIPYRHNPAVPIVRYPDPKRAVLPHPPVKGGERHFLHVVTPNRAPEPLETDDPS